MDMSDERRRQGRSAELAAGLGAWDKELSNSSATQRPGRAPSPAPSPTSTTSPWELVLDQDAASLPTSPWELVPDQAARGLGPICLPGGLGPSNPSPSMAALIRRQVWSRISACEMCRQSFPGEPDPFMFSMCRGCGAVPCYHHGRCCPAKKMGLGQAAQHRSAEVILPEGDRHPCTGDLKISAEDMWFKGAPMDVDHIPEESPLGDEPVFDMCFNGSLPEESPAEPLPQDMDSSSGPGSHIGWLHQLSLGSVRCPVCKVWYNSEAQYQQHCRGRKHRLNSGLSKNAVWQPRSCSTEAVVSRRADMAAAGTSVVQL